MPENVGQGADGAAGGAEAARQPHAGELRVVGVAPAVEGVRHGVATHGPALACLQLLRHIRLECQPDWVLVSKAEI